MTHCQRQKLNLSISESLCSQSLQRAFPKASSLRESIAVRWPNRVYDSSVIKFRAKDNLLTAISTVKRLLFRLQFVCETSVECSLYWVLSMLMLTNALYDGVASRHTLHLIDSARTDAKPTESTGYTPDGMFIEACV